MFERGVERALTDAQSGSDGVRPLSDDDRTRSSGIGSGLIEHLQRLGNLVRRAAGGRPRTLDLTGERRADRAGERERLTELRPRRREVSAVRLEEAEAAMNEQPWQFSCSVVVEHLA